MSGQPFKFTNHEMRMNMAFAYNLAAKSPDCISQHGAILYSDSGELLGSGYNRFPTGFGLSKERFEIADDDDEKAIKEKQQLKNRHMECAPRAAIYDVIVRGKGSYNSTLFCPCGLCMACGRALASTSCLQIVLHKDRLLLASSREQQMYRETLDCLVGTTYIRHIEGPVPCQQELRVLVGGRPWSPNTLEFD